MAVLEKRKDVIKFMSPELKWKLEVIGRVRLTLFVRSSAASADFFARLCLVKTGKLGRKFTENVTDGYLRIGPGDGQDVGNGVRRIEIDMWATAQRWSPGQYLRLLICSAAHPRYMANTLTSEPVTQEIYHDLRYPSALHLPIVKGTLPLDRLKDPGNGQEDTSLDRLTSPSGPFSPASAPGPSSPRSVGDFPLSSGDEGRGSAGAQGNGLRPQSSSHSPQL